MNDAGLRKKIVHRCSCQRGFSLMELLAATIVLLLIAAALAVGIPVTLNAYEQVTATAEATALLSTLSESLADELRYAQDIKLQSSDNVTLATFTSSVFGQEVKPVSHEGKIQMVHTTIPAGTGTPVTTYYPLLSEAVYTRGLLADITSITYDGETFSLGMNVYIPADSLSTITEDTILAEAEIQIKTINE
ncbi:MAG: prepilin-type N-terminal cleavage/methylation domain-containing protein [Clostridia bacterium]|nr:prepilin-type N-terminal cleavage/methylation domain-containing protein [Clostridia bacterium]